MRAAARGRACASGRRSSTVSAKTGRGIGRLLDRVEELFEKHTARIPTAELNRFLGELREAREPPSQRRQAA